MKACTFFGHRDCPDTIYPRLKNCIEDLIVNQGVGCFYVGHQGRFDALALRALRELQAAYPIIKHYVVLAYLPQKEMPYPTEETLYPEGLESVPPRYAITHRNRWMLAHADCVITNVAAPVGGAAMAKKEASRKGKTVIELQ